VTFKRHFSSVIDFTVAIVLTFTMSTAIWQARGALSRGLSYVNLDVRGDLFVMAALCNRAGHYIFAL